MSIIGIIYKCQKCGASLRADEGINNCPKCYATVSISVSRKRNAMFIRPLTYVTNRYYSSRLYAVEVN